MANNLKVQLEAREDKEHQTYYIGKLNFPGTITLGNGATFLIFTSEKDAEELQIAVNNKEHTTYGKYSLREDRLKIGLEKREDQYEQTFYVTKVQFNGYINCNAGIVFIVFTSKQGLEELQIVGDVRME